MTKFRLIGIGVSEFADPALADPDDLIDPAAAKRAKAEHAVDMIRDRFGTKAVELGLVFDTAQEAAADVARHKSPLVAGITLALDRATPERTVTALAGPCAAFTAIVKWSPPIMAAQHAF